MLLLPLRLFSPPTIDISHSGLQWHLPGTSDTSVRNHGNETTPVIMMRYVWQNCIEALLENARCEDALRSALQGRTGTPPPLSLSQRSSSFMPPAGRASHLHLALSSSKHLLHQVPLHLFFGFGWFQLSIVKLSLSVRPPSWVPIRIICSKDFCLDF